MALQKMPASQERRTKLDQCQLRLIKAKEELRSLAFLFEHLKDSPYTANDLAGVSVTLERVAAGIEKAIKAVDEIY